MSPVERTGRQVGAVSPVARTGQRVRATPGWTTAGADRRLADLEQWAYSSRSLLWPTVRSDRQPALGLPAYERGLAWALKHGH